MIKRTIGILCTAALLGGGVSLAQQTQETEKTLNLTLDDCIMRALKNNLGIAIQELAPQSAEYSLQQAKEMFIPSLSFSFNSGETRQASYSWLDAVSESTFSQNGSLSGTINQFIPTGGSLSVSMNGSKTNTTARGQLINPRYDARLSLTLNQPLLRNFGFKMNRRPIIIAQNNFEKADYDFRANVASAIYSVETAYWTLVYNVENLKVVRQSLKLAQDQLEKNKRAVEIGTMAPKDILTAQSEVARRDAEIISAEASVKLAEDNLSSLLNLLGDEKSARALIPVDKPSLDIKPVDLDQSILIARQNRPELKSLRLDLDNQNLAVSYAKNQLLPNLSLNFTYASPGISGDRIQYQDNNPFTGIVVGTVSGGVGDALRDALRFLYKNWSVRMTLDVPLSNILSRASLASAQVSLRQTELTLKNREQQIYLEIKSAVRDLETKAKQVQAQKVARELAEQNLAAEEEKLRVGLSVPYTVLQFQRDLASAQTSELNAIIGLNNARAKLEQVLGTSLESRGIRIQELLNKN